MINKEFVFSYNLGLIALMNGIIVLGFASCSHSLVLLFPNCTQNHAVTYTKHMDYIIYALSIAIYNAILENITSLLPSVCYECAAQVTMPTTKKE